MKRCFQAALAAAGLIAFAGQAGAAELRLPPSLTAFGATGNIAPFTATALSQSEQRGPSFRTGQDALAGDPIRLMEFHRPSEMIFSSPDGQIFFLTAPFGPDGTSINFHRVAIDAAGRLSVQPHLGIALQNKDAYKEFDRIVRCFMPDLKNSDGSFDFILGYAQSNVAPFVRVINDFIPPHGAAR